MTAWPAAKELRVEGAVEGLVGLGVLVVALTTGADRMWLAAVLVAVLLGAAAWRVRAEARALAAAEPLPADTLPATRGQFALRLPLVLASALCTAGIGAIAPVLLPVGVALLFGAAILAFARAATIGRWERAHGGRIVRANEDAFGEQYFLLAH